MDSAHVRLSVSLCVRVFSLQGVTTPRYDYGIWWPERQEWHWRIIRNLSGPWSYTRDSKCVCQSASLSLSQWNSPHQDCKAVLRPVLLLDRLSLICCAPCSVEWRRQSFFIVTDKPESCETCTAVGGGPCWVCLGLTGYWTCSLPGVDWGVYAVLRHLRQTQSSFVLKEEAHVREGRWKRNTSHSWSSGQATPTYPCWSLSFLLLSLVSFFPSSLSSLPSLFLSLSPRLP